MVCESLYVNLLACEIIIAIAIQPLKEEDLVLPTGGIVFLSLDEI